MPRIVETTVYSLNELSETARDQACNWYRQVAVDDDWYDRVYDDFETICGIPGVRLKTRPVRLFGGGTRAKPCIYFSGFWSQGDGARCEARYAYAKDAPRRQRSGAIFTSSMPTSRIAAATIMNTAWRFPSRVMARRRRS